METAKATDARYRLILNENERLNLFRVLDRDGLCRLPELPLSAQACLARSLTEFPQIWVTDGPQTMDTLLDSLETMGASPRILSFPAFENPEKPSPEISGKRMKTLQSLDRCGESSLVVSCVQALLQPIPARGILRNLCRRFAPGSEVDLAELESWLYSSGYQFEAEVYQRGQVARRGGILDIWLPTEDYPSRIELFGPQIDSIRYFDPGDQRSLDKDDLIQVYPINLDNAVPKGGSSEPSAGISAYLGDSVRWVWSDPERIVNHWQLYKSSLPADSEWQLGEETPSKLLESIREEVVASGPQIEIGWTQNIADSILDWQPYRPDIPSVQDLHPELIQRQRLEFVCKLTRAASQGWDVILFFETPAALERFREIYREQENFEQLILTRGLLHDSFRSDAHHLIVLSESDLYGYRSERPLSRRRSGRNPRSGRRIEHFRELIPGEMVVHVENGVGKYMGLYEMEISGRLEEVLMVEYAEEAKLYLPVSQAHLLTRYVGVGRHNPDLDSLATRRWIKKRQSAVAAIRDVASDLLETQAVRATKRGIAYPADTPLQIEFEAAFPYLETEDQQSAISDLKLDMERQQPMDRLLCGDAGYGKTEVAMRAAFKAVMGGYQVAFLVPTTLLAQQHFDSFCARMAAFPVKIAMLSRFRTRAQQKAILKDLGRGKVDIVIGTHRLTSSDLIFQNLGLLIVDEEQRFGVKHKEHFKKMREEVDVLTLTATPIPRTLYMSMTGVRDMSTIQTAPAERKPIQTLVSEYREDLVRRVVLRELNREGQVFYLHNRVRTIEQTCQRLRELIPEAKIEMAHGQMEKRRLENIMRHFVRGEIDLLLCTTIIESGVDIPRVNTILIERAERFGLSDLYQLRGRVGRSDRQAYAYLLLPRHGRLFSAARKRIQAMKHHSDLGAGLKLALRDLEIRGAGNLLGARQSGHIMAIGFELYCQLLKRTVAEMRGEKIPPVMDVSIKLDFMDFAPSHTAKSNLAMLPVDYVEDESLRVRLYQRIASLARMVEISQFRKELTDRFGKPPREVGRLFKIAELRIAAAQKKIDLVNVYQSKVRLRRDAEYIKINRRLPSLKSRTPARKMKELIRILKKDIPKPKPPNLRD